MGREPFEIKEKVDDTLIVRLMSSKWFWGYIVMMVVMFIVGVVISVNESVQPEETEMPEDQPDMTITIQDDILAIHLNTSEAFPVVGIDSPVSGLLGGESINVSGTFQDAEFTVILIDQEKKSEWFTIGYYEDMYQVDQFDWDSVEFIDINSSMTYELQVKKTDRSMSHYNEQNIAIGRVEGATLNFYFR